MGGRKPLPVGSHGRIRITEITTSRVTCTACRMGVCPTHKATVCKVCEVHTKAHAHTSVFEARCQYRDLNGDDRYPSARGRSKTAAEYALKERIQELAKAAKVGEVTRDTRFNVVVGLWLADLDHKVEHSGRAYTTARTYRSYLTGHIVPRFGKLQLREIKAAAVDEFVKKIRKEMGYESAKKVKSIISAIADFAIRRGAENWVNPTKAIEEINAGPAEDVVAMTVDQVADMLKGMRAYAVELDEKAVEKKDGRAAWRNTAWHDLPELAEAMLATGVRIGEVLALSGEDVILGEDGRVLVNVDAHLVWVKGKGVVRQPGRKAGQPALLLEVPGWSRAMFLRRKMAAGSGPLFAAIGGGWLDATNVNKRIKTAMTACGFEWVTSHVWRHTVATLLDEADLPVSDVAGQLGNTKAVAERHYIKRRATNARAAAALEAALGKKVSGA